MIDKLFKTQQQQKLINLFNYIFETDIIYKALFQPFKRHLNDIKEHLEGGNPQEHFHYGSRMYDYIIFKLFK